jgi:hypothetical protein
MQHPNQRRVEADIRDQWIRPNEYEQMLKEHHKDAALKCTWWGAAMLLYEACMAVSLWLVIKVRPATNSLRPRLLLPTYIETPLHV